MLACSLHISSAESPWVNPTLNCHLLITLFVKYRYVSLKKHQVAPYWASERAFTTIWNSYNSLRSKSSLKWKLFWKTQLLALFSSSSHYFRCKNLLKLQKSFKFYVLWKQTILCLMNVPPYNTTFSPFFTRRSITEMKSHNKDSEGTEFVNIIATKSIFNLLN